MVVLKKRDLIYGILFFIQLKPESIVFLSPKIDYIWDVLRYISFVIIFGISLYKYKKLLKSKGFIIILSFIIFFYGSVFIGTLTTNPSNLMSCLYEGIRTLSVFLVISLLTLNGVRKEAGILICVYSIYIIINFITVIFYPNGMYVNRWGIYLNYFLGAKNVFALYSLPCVTLIGYKIITGTKKFSYLIILLLSFLSSVIVWSGSNMLIIGLMIIGILSANYFTKFYKLFNFRNYLIITLFIFVTIVIFQNLKVFSWLIETVLHKDLTLTGRIGIWDSSIRVIKERPIFGYGVLDGNAIIRITNNRFGINTHNMFLWCLFIGGIVNLANLIVLLLRLNIEISKYRSNKVMVFISWSVFMLLVSWMVEANVIAFNIPLIVLPFRISEFLNKDNVQKTKVLSNETRKLIVPSDQF